MAFSGPSASDAAQRRMMVDCQVRPFDVTDQRILDRMLDVERETFVTERLRSLAYSDAALTLESPDSDARTLLAPMVLARLLQNADLTPGCRVLDVAAGLGYSAALVAGLVHEVVVLEEGGFAAAAQKALRGYPNVVVREGTLDGEGLSDGPFDVILVNGAMAVEPAHLIPLLIDGGRLMTVRAGSGATNESSYAVRYEKVGGVLAARRLFNVTAPVLKAFARKPAFAF